MKEGWILRDVICEPPQIEGGKSSSNTVKKSDKNKDKVCNFRIFLQQLNLN